MLCRPYRLLKLLTVEQGESRVMMLHQRQTEGTTFSLNHYLSALSSSTHELGWQLTHHLMLLAPSNHQAFDDARHPRQ